MFGLIIIQQYCNAANILIKIIFQNTGAVFILKIICDEVTDFAGRLRILKNQEYGCYCLESK
jgi:hypothetical protein